MATDIIARGMAANAKKSVTELGNKVESEKWIGTKAEWEAVDKSTIKDGTIVYITDDKTVILYDKAEMEKIAAQVATDKTSVAADKADIVSMKSEIANTKTYINETVQTISENANSVKQEKIAIDETKTDIDKKYTEISNTATKLNTEYNNLTSNYYTKEATNSLISSTTKPKYSVVNELPTSDISTDIIYLKSTGTTSTDGVYEMYTYQDSNWVKIGTSNPDLADYYTKELVDSTFATKTEINNTNTEVSELKEDLYTVNIVESRNKLNKDACIIGIIKNDGTIDTSYTNYHTSEFIPISENEEYRLARWNKYNCLTTTIRAVMIYDAQRQPLLSERLNDFNGIGKAVEKSAYIRISISGDWFKSNLMLFIGDTIDSTRYIPYEKRREISLNPSINLNALIEKNEPLKSIAQSCIEQISDEYKVGSYYINSNYVISKSSNWEMYMLKNIYRKITYKGYCEKGICAIGFYSDNIPSDKSFIGGLTVDRSGVNIVEFVLDEKTIPDGTISILLCSRVVAGDIHVEMESFIAKKYINESKIRIESVVSEIEGKGNVKAIYKSIPNANDFTIIKDEIWFAENIYEDGVATDHTTVHRYKIIDGFLVKIGDIDTDFGHWNTVDYCEDNDCLIFGNGANSIQTDGNYFVVVKNPLSLGDVARIETCGIKYTVDIGFKVQAVWGDSNYGSNNIVYLISNSCQKITKVLLLKDSNGNFNGQYVTLETKDIELDKYYGVGGADFWGDTLYIGIGGPYEMFKMSMSDYSIQKITKHFYKDDGSEYNGSTQGVHIDSQYIWVFSNIAGSSVNYLTQYRR